MLAAAAEPSVRFESSRPHRADDDEQALVNAARSGDRAAFARLHQRYAPMVHGIALARAPVSDAGDIVQDVFLQAMRTMHTLRDSAAIGPWLASIARNFAAETCRRRKLTPTLALRNPVASGFVPASHDEAARILDVIRSLPETYSETLVLRLVEGLTGPQIAACTGLTDGSVRVNLHRGMQLLREKLGREFSS